MAFVMFALHAASARAQVASYIDETGKRVYINTPPPLPKKAPEPATKPKEKPGAGEPTATRTTPAPPQASGTVGPAPRPAKEQLQRMVHETAERHQVDPKLVRAVIETESDWNPSALSHKGAFGLMQLVPGTAQRMGVTNVFDPQQNLDGGVKYLRSLLDRYNGNVPLTLAAYNAGEHAVDRWRGVPNYRETRQYVRKVSNSYFRSGSSESDLAAIAQRTIRRIVDERGRVVYTNE